eukprot:GHRQ01001453.1.p1 GENE.GHRQ01001453.1~~GHRQ01001453.1.p1  ORF type:complete len:362 (+),score=85.62 GHRQ01001453.1:231-1316(+)
MSATHSSGGLTLAGISPSANSTSALMAMRNNTLGVGFSGSGFLILYFTGVTAVLQSLGIINNRTYLAGSSGGAVTAAATCSNVPAATRQLATNMDIAAACRPTVGCRGSLDSVLRKSASALLPETVTEQCKRRLFTTFTEARRNNQTDLPQVLTNISSKGALLDAIAASSYLPYWSGPSAVTSLGRLPAVYDGGFSYPLPCPPGVTYCVTVSSRAPAPANVSGPSAAGQSTLDLLMAGRNGSDNSSAAFLPLNPQTVPAPAHLDIYPGLSGRLNVTAQLWNTYGLVIPDNSTLVYLYNQGRQDAAAWVRQHGLAQPAQVLQALQSTQVPAAAPPQQRAAPASVGKPSGGRRLLTSPLHAVL